MAPLPAGPLDLLHIFPVYMNWILGLALTLVILAVLGWLVAWFFEQRKKQNAAAPAVPRARREAKGLIEDIMLEYVHRKAYREGCHRLSAFLKEFYENRYNVPVEEMTPAEIAKALPGRDRGGLFQRLGQLQFGLHEPDEKSFEKICKEAARLVEKEPVLAGPA
ncbi:MAG: hypothetical protein HY042_02770 [Spirochaetia bacterium]|nr:hypothetical protein [Spirochaetia bacterium]